MFVALMPPPEAADDLDAFLDVRRDTGDLRWSAPDQVHLTLAFCADVPERAYDDLVERLERAAAKRTAFECRIAGGGAFPDAARAKVVWAGLETEDDAAGEELDLLAAGARAAANRAGAPTDGARFRPHLTVGRPRFPHDVTRWVRLLDSYAGPWWSADEIVLVHSHLGEGPRGRPRHEVVETFALSQR